MVPFRTAIDGLYSFALNDVIPHMPNGAKKFAVLVGIGGFKHNPDFIIKPYMPFLKMSGIMSEDGSSVDEQRLAVALTDAFAQMPSVDFLGFTFSADDANKLVDRISRGQ